MEVVLYLNGSCHSTFWDANTTWNTDDPDFTPCFEDTVLTWIPCAFLWLFLPLQVYYIRHSQSYRIPFSLYNIVKLVLIGSMSALVLTDAVYYLFSQEYVPAKVASSLITFFTFVHGAVISLSYLVCSINQ